MVDVEIYCAECNGLQPTPLPIPHEKVDSIHWTKSKMFCCHCADSITFYIKVKFDDRVKSSFDTLLNLAEAYYENYDNDAEIGEVLNIYNQLYG